MNKKRTTHLSKNETELYRKDILRRKRLVPPLKQPVSRADVVSLYFREERKIKGRR